MAALNFNAANVSPGDSFTPLPAGDYLVMITRSEMVPTTTGGEQLKLQLEVIDGQYKGRMLWDRLNLVNKSTATVEIAQRTLSQICHAVGVMTPQDSTELHDKPLIAKVVYRPADGKYDEGNDIKGYKPANGFAAQKAPVQQAPAQPEHKAAQAASGKPAWAQ